MNTITYYKQSGEIDHETLLNKSTIKDFHGMKVRCSLYDGSEHIGFANTRSNWPHITLETFVNLDEDTHTFIGEGRNKYDIKKELLSILVVRHIDAILYSGLRWGGVPTNKFNL